MESEQPWIRENDTVERNKRARTAYEALLTVTARIPETEEYKNFSREVKEIARRELNFEYGKEEVHNNGQVIINIINEIYFHIFFIFPLF